MSYVPQNQHTFDAAASGALSGIGIGERPITSTDPDDYDDLAAAAFAFAQEFDTQWAETELDEFEWSAIVTASCNYWENRNKRSTNPTDYTAECAAIIAAIRAGDNFILAQGIDIPAWPPGGSGSGTVTDVTGTSPIVITGSATTTPNVTHDVSGVNPGTFGSPSAGVGIQITVDAKGHVTGCGIGANVSAAAYVWQDNAALITASISGTEVGVTITPALTGKLVARVTGVAKNSDTGTAHTLTLGLAGVDGLTYNSGTGIQINEAITGTPGSTPFSMIVALDMLPVPVVPALATPFTVDFVFSSDSNTAITIAAHSVQFEVQERG